jgi:glutathione S-transferase
LLADTIPEEPLGVLDGFPRVSAYRERCEARPAWRRTLDAYEQRLGALAGSAR